jgi:hypothetical protein
MVGTGVIEKCSKKVNHKCTYNKRFILKPMDS